MVEWCPKTDSFKSTMDKESKASNEMQCLKCTAIPAGYIKSWDTDILTAIL